MKTINQLSQITGFDNYTDIVSFSMLNDFVNINIPNAFRITNYLY